MKMNKILRFNLPFHKKKIDYLFFSNMFVFLLLLVFIGAGSTIYAQDGTVGNPFTNINQVTDTTPNGFYHFNFSGTSFATTVENGELLIVNDVGAPMSQVLSTTSSLNTSTRGRLETSVLANLGNITTIVIRSSDGAVRAESKNPALISRIKQGKTLHQGVSDNTINDSWIGSSSAVSLIEDATCTTSFLDDLSSSVFHVCGASNGFTWIPVNADRKISFSSGNVNDNVGFGLWVKNDESAPTISTLSSLSGCSGSNLVINGTNLAGVQSVTIGGTMATIVSTSATSVAVTVGSGSTGVVSVTNGVGTASSIDVFTVTPVNTVSAASSSPTLCINTVLTNITHTTTGASDIGTPSGLPAGVIATFASNTITISGTPTVSGTFNYSIPLVGGCGTVSATGIITVNATLTTSFGSTATICYNREVASPNVGGVTFSAVPFNRYVTLNVIQGLQYRIATTASDIGLVKKITLYNNAAPATALSSSSASSTTSSASLDWTASFTGVLRIEFTATNCQTNPNTDTLTATFIGGSNTADNPNLAGTDSWIGHVYDFTNNPDIVPVPPSDANAFANYLGSFTQSNTVSGSTISFNNNYGGENNCYSFIAGGTAHSFRTDTFAVRYRMNTTPTVYPAGCYLVNIAGDDGVRLYIDGVLVFNSWRQQSTTNYNNVLVYLNGSSQLVFDYYEKNGGNVSNFNIRPASTSITSLNTIVTSGPINRCVGTTTLLDGSVVATKGNNTIDPVKYQWQSSTDNSNWTNIAGATAEDYTVPATNPSTSTVIYYKRNVFGSTASSAACVYSTASIAITTNPSVSAPTVGVITNITCSSTTGSVVLSGLPSGSWTINQSGTNSSSYLGSGTSYTVTGLAVGGYTFTVSRGGCTSSPTLNVPIVDASSTTWNGSTWTNGVPDATKNIIIASSSGVPFAANLTGCALTINNGVTATVPSGVTLTITNAVTTNGQLIFENNASLVQTTNATNTGAIEYRRISKPMKNFDYTYWSSPVTGQNIVTLSPNTLADKYFRFSGSANDWVLYNNPTTSTMIPGVGYIIRVPKPGSPAPDNWSGLTYPQPVAFKGTPNNGNYSFAVGANELNLVGNPYPSAIRADDFITANTSIIYGALYFWTHNTAIAPSGSDYVYTANDYATYNITGGTAGGPLPIPVTGPAPSPGLNTSVPNGFIAAGQSFFVENAAAGSFQFTNAMRAAGNNSQFFKQANTKKTATIEKNRVWLNLTNSGGAFKQLLVGYITGATNDWDNMYDGPTFDGQEFVDFYSVNQGKNLTIQGRALPFIETDVVPLGYRSTIAGPFDISIDNRDGALSNQEIWLEDKKTNTLHELSKGKYTFTAINGVENDRFVLKYTGKTLGTDDNEVAVKSLIVSVKNKKITLTSSAEAITQVQIFDLLGRKVYDKSKINAQEWSISNLSSSEQTLIVKTTLANGAISNNKIIY
ncbi:T9SS sorting signal type C domain-containing protein [Flavobacterium sp. RSSB_23]|uniref:T9SS sorting signal type C domain-containing protein n=1 Tax=Flavobacterium sp. RSSB_23 TaxID=3447668 RepID=UPI003F3A02CE